ncbi:formin-like protein 13 [Phoenix dactylifera]|uniref:Formin-like protein 13 n=1 Tax=Phoenix dactylifera TaxID=42345 RepID=A0A8B8IYF1_PHODC|nr:formin-like protein 13 [Phoenix dactylifera]
MNKCMNAVRHVWELEKKIKYACRRGDPRKETLANELQKHEITLTKCLEKLISVEANRAALVSQLKAALEEQESTLENVRTQIQVAQGTLEEAEDMQRQVHDEPVVMSAKLPPSAEPPKPNSNYPALQPQNKGTAAIAAEVANKFAASTRSLKIKTSVLSAFVAEEAESAYLVRSADSINSEPPAKKMKLENPMPVSNPSATATAFMPVPQMAISAPHPPQTVLVQQTPIQNQTMSFQPQFNLYQSSTMQYLQPSEGVMTGLLDSYNALPPPPSPPPQMMNLTMPVSLTHQQQQPVALFQQPPPPPPMYQPLPINRQPTNQPVSINQQPAQSSIRKPMAPSYRPLLPPRMAFYNPQTQ